MPENFDYDLVVIGAGSGGVRASRMSAQLGKKVAVIEDRYLGGTCVNVGCVPKKLFVYASEMAHTHELSAGFGVNYSRPEIDWPTLRDNKTNEIERLNGIYGNLLDNAGVELINGRGKVVSPHEVEVNGKVISAKTILLATGGWPTMPDVPGKEYMISSNEVFYLEDFPQKVLCLGGGYISVEFAGIFNGLGADTTLLYRGEKILRGFDEDVRDFAQQEVAKTGVDIKLNLNIVSVVKTDSGLEVEFTDGSKDTFDVVFAAIGRTPNLEGLGAVENGVELNKNGTIKTNEFFQTSVPSIYALGDLIPGPQLTPVALAEAMVLVDNLYKGASRTLDYDHVATAVFCQPNIGTVGLTEKEANDEGYDVSIYKSDFRPMKHTISGSDERTFMKLVVDKASDKVLGVHMVGPDAGEIIQGMAVALKAGATKAVFDSTIGIHPTAAEEFVTMRTATS